MFFLDRSPRAGLLLCLALYLVLSCGSAGDVRSQNVGIGTNSPNASALLDLTSTSLGLLPPRVTNVQMTAIAAPATGLLVYNTTFSGFYYYDGAAWEPFGWWVKGNSGTVAGTNYLGTNDAVDMVFKTNSTERLRILSGGNVGINTNSPGQLLEVLDGNIFLNNNDNTAAQLLFAEPSTSGANYSSFKARAQPSNINYILPDTLCVKQSELAQDGSGNMRWRGDHHYNMITGPSWTTGGNKNEIAVDANGTIFRISSTSTTTVITGIAANASMDGRMIMFCNVGGNSIGITSMSGLSTHPILTSQSSIAPNSIMTLIFDNTSGFWRALF